MSNNYAQFIKNLRLREKISQLEIAKKLGLSRSSYIAFEQGERDLSLSEASQLSQIFGVSLEEIFAGKADQPIMAIKKSWAQKKEGEKKITGKTADRVSVPQERVAKFKQVLLYILAKVGGKPNIGQTVLYKLLYFIDFDYYEKYEEQLIGARYIKNTHGPTPVIFTKIIKELEAKGSIEAIKSKFYKYDQTKYLINPEVQLDLSELSGQELAHIDWEIERLSDLTATQISDLSHKDTPWAVAKDRQVLNYEHAFYRPEETSVGEYDPL
ncbi:MAG: DUF4065 domain-containing protein [Candidatus Vogelbacteria bacterium]|nr:DUF4065 domain-containing protein [Candidatus Vogelbacteria bacterium]